MWLLLGAATALAVGYIYMQRQISDALALLNFAPYGVQKGVLYRFTFLSPADESVDTMNMWLQQNWYLAPKAPPKKLRSTSLKGPTDVPVDVWEVDAVPTWPAFATQQVVTPDNYFKLLLANLYPEGPPAGLNGVRGLAAALFIAATSPRDVPGRRMVVFVGARPLEG